MGRIHNAIMEINEMDEMAEKETGIHQLHPLVKLIVTFLYLISVLSYSKYDIAGLLTMILYPLILFHLADISIRSCFHKLRVILPMICAIGIWNPFFDHTPFVRFHGMLITGGMVSMVTLIVKGIFALMASFLLIATTGMERLCYALKLLHIPGILVTQILLVYRYIEVLMKEAKATFEAYSLRAPGEKGVKYKIWGSLLGQLLFRSIDRASDIYDSMLLRGFHGEFYYAGRQKPGKTDYLYLLLWLVIIAALRAANPEAFLKMLILH